MIKTLQRKFIITAMAAITVLILVLLGTVNIINIWRVSNEADNTLGLLIDNETRGVPQPGADSAPDASESDAMPIQPEEPYYDMAPQDEPKDNIGMHEIFNPSISEDMVMAARYFVARISNDGDIVYVDTSNISSVDDEAALEYAGAVIESGSSDGTYRGFRYQIAASEDGQGRVVIFLNVNDIKRTILSVLIISVIMGLAGWVLMLLLVVCLSRHAIRPIAANIERQKQFVTDAGHEIKTPLAIIIANTDAMELHNGETKWSRNIRGQAERLSGLMNNLLALAKMEERSTEATRESVNMSILVNELTDSFEELAELRKIAIKRSIAADVSANVNMEQITQLITILMDNAVKYSVEGGTIYVSVSRVHKECVMTFRNSCESLPDAEADRLFDRFYRGDSARTQKSGGYGIGLSVAKAIADTNRGRITAAYEGDKHIVFTVALEQI